MPKTSGKKPLGFSVGQLQDSAVRLTLPPPSKKRIRQQIIENLFKSIFLRIIMLPKLLQNYTFFFISPNFQSFFSLSSTLN